MDFSESGPRFPTYTSLVARLRTSNNHFAVVSSPESDVVELLMFSEGWRVAESWQQPNTNSTEFSEQAIENAKYLIDMFYDPTNTQITVFEKGELLNQDYGV